MSLVCLILCMDLLLMCDFITTWINHLENNDLLNSVDTFHYAVSVTFIDITVFTTKVLKYWKAFKLMWYIQIFQDYVFSLESVFYHWQQTLTVLFRSCFGTETVCWVSTTK